MSKGRPSLVIGERDPFMREALRAALEADYDLEFYADGAALLERVRRCPPDLVILEVLLPGLDGFQVCCQIVSDPACGHVPVLIFTWLRARERAAQVGAGGFILKPLRREELLETVRRLLAGRPADRGEEHHGTSAHPCAPPG
ncbi:MAG: response regulator [Chloroflexia bacterium]